MKICTPSRSKKHTFANVNFNNCSRGVSFLSFSNRGAAVWSGRISLRCRIGRTNIRNFDEIDPPRWRSRRAAKAGIARCQSENIWKQITDFETSSFNTSGVVSFGRKSEVDEKRGKARHTHPPTPTLQSRVYFVDFGKCFQLTCWSLKSASMQAKTSHLDLTKTFRTPARIAQHGLPENGGESDRNGGISYFWTGEEVNRICRFIRPRLWV